MTAGLVWEVDKHFTLRDGRHTKHLAPGSHDGFQDISFHRVGHIPPFDRI
jgi:hypothetical protein